MKVILLKDLRNYGKKNDIITVADGYAKNYLLPQKIAIVASSQALVRLGKQQQKFDNEVNEKKLENEALKLEIEKLILNFDLKINKNKVFGTITSKQIIEKLSQEYNIQVDKKQLVNYQNINTIGINDINIKLFNDIFAILKIQVVGKK
ncbi:50S ribosomal protein L9 [Spiroplasma endosymbiont of 'Nebria riversi']|uniref:50S ribosomal protein L9 n=1 Tax=Spiroplasma endosymbiont of 'Nebria riversi' TaxID=2792084 RepID=UPI001C05B980|nr:50S ribosomal protein L9 [Spiroplasma endosymbiont of 'Nebria riversi']